MNKDDVLKIIDGRTYYSTDYIYFLYNELQKRDEVIKEVREYIEKHQCCDGKINVMTLTEYKELLEILDKEVN